MPGSVLSVDAAQPAGPDHPEVTHGRQGSALSAYRADIDGLRAVAVLLVLVFHFKLIPGGKAGFIGVDVFFVISGYLITSILRRQLTDNTLNLATFYVGRIRRLAPALAVTLVLVWAAGLVVLFPDDLVMLSKQTLASQLYVANVYYWLKINYFGLGTDNVFLLHMWSLAVEEQFYLVYPLALWVVHKVQKERFWAAIGFALLVSFALNVAFVARKPEATFYLLPTRAWELLTGALLPYVAARWARSRVSDELLGGLGTGLLIAAVLGYTREIRFPGYFALLPVLGAACLLLSGSSRTTLTSWVLSRAPIVYVGKISYPLYLVHWPVNVFASQVMAPDYGIGQRFAMFAFSGVLASAIFHLAETPIRHRNAFALNRNLLWAYGAGLAMTLTMYVVVTETGGLPGRFPSEVSRLASFVNDKSPPLAQCEYAGQPLSQEGHFCRLGNPADKLKWLIYGDSHAWAAHAAFEAWLKHKGQSGLFMFRHSCPPLIGVQLFADKGICNAFNRSVFDFLSRRTDISNVVLVSTWRQAPEGRLSTSHERALSQRDSLDLFETAFADTLKLLNSFGKRVYVWEPLPGAQRSVPLAMARAELDHKPARLEISRAKYFAEFDFFFQALKKNRNLITASFSPSDSLCESGQCAVTIDGRPAYFDNGHITRSTAEFWVRMMQRGEISPRAVERAP